MDLMNLKDLGQQIYENGPGALIGAIVGAIVGLQIPTKAAECPPGDIPTLMGIGTEIRAACTAPNGVTYLVDGPDPWWFFLAVVGAIVGGLGWRRVRSS